MKPDVEAHICMCAEMVSGDENSWKLSSGMFGEEQQKSYPISNLHMHVVAWEHTHTYTELTRGQGVGGWTERQTERGGH